MKNNQMYNWMKDLFSLNRSILGDGIRKSLNYFKKINPEFKIINFKSGRKIFDWQVPNEWNVKNAYIKDLKGNKFAEFNKNNLHLVGYSIPIKKRLTKKELFKKIYVENKNSDAIPYITSYYDKDWGFCMSKKQRQKLRGSHFDVVIDSKIEKGKLSLMELVLRGKSKKEIFFSTYLCHPSMANNELSGPVVQNALIKFIKKNYKKPKYSYRFVILPETIGSIAYLSNSYKKLKKNVIAGFNLTCLGDNRAYSLIRSRSENTLADLALRSVLMNKKNFKDYSYTEKGSDERQYCAPGIDLPVATFCRSKFGEFKEYHTSLDNLKLVKPKNLNESLDVLKDIITGIETSLFPKTNFLCEPFLNKYQLYNGLSEKKKYNNIKNLLNAISYADGYTSIFEISIKTNIKFKELLNYYSILKEKKIIS